MASNVPSPLLNNVICPETGRSCTFASAGPDAVQDRSASLTVPPSVYSVNPSLLTEIDKSGW